MKLDLNITFDDLSEECKAKIKKLQKMFGKDNFRINYPDINELVSPAIDWTKQITVPAQQYPNVTYTATNRIDSDNAQLLVKSSDNPSKKYGLVSEMVLS